MTKTQTSVPHVFDEWQKIAERISAAEDIRLFLDFDGTLVSYCESPGDVKLSGESRRILARLARHPRVHITIVSGRRNSALKKFVPVPRAQFMGLFGWEKSTRPFISRSAKATMRGLRPILAPLPALFPGVCVEDKGISHAVHFRGASPDVQRTVQIRVRRLLAPHGRDIHILRSSHACEIVPRQVQGKGVAMREFVRAIKTPCLPIYIGDDLTDEPAFIALRSGITIRVGPFSKTRARFRLRDPEEVRIFLERIGQELC